MNINVRWQRPHRIALEWAIKLRFLRSHVAINNARTYNFNNNSRKLIVFQWNLNNFHLVESARFSYENDVCCDFLVCVFFVKFIQIPNNQKSLSVCHLSSYVASIGLSQCFGAWFWRFSSFLIAVSISYHFYHTIRSASDINAALTVHLKKEFFFFIIILMGSRFSHLFR